MNVHCLNTPRIMRISLMVGLLSLAASYTTIAHAAGGCGFGYHRTFFGGCVLNHPGPWATPAPLHPGCWRNRWGQLRCYRY